MSDAPKSANFQYVVAVLVMSAFGIISVIGITMLRPNEDNAVLIASCLGFLLPTTMALLAFLKSQETHLTVNSRLQSMIEATERASKAEGIIEGVAEGERRADVISAQKAATVVINGTAANTKNKPEE